MTGVDLDLILGELERAYLAHEAAAGSDDSETDRLWQLFKVCELTLDLRRLTEDRTRLLCSLLLEHQTPAAELGRITDSSPAAVEVAVMVATKPYPFGG